MGVRVAAAAFSPLCLQWRQCASGFAPVLDIYRDAFAWMAWRFDRTTEIRITHVKSRHELGDMKLLETLCAPLGKAAESEIPNPRTSTSILCADVRSIVWSRLCVVVFRTNRVTSYGGDKFFGGWQIFLFPCIICSRVRGVNCFACSGHQH